MPRCITGHVIGKSSHKRFKKSHLYLSGIDIDIKALIHREDIAVDTRMNAVRIHDIGIQCHGHTLGIP